MVEEELVEEEDEGLDEEEEELVEEEDEELEDEALDELVVDSDSETSSAATFGTLWGPTGNVSVRSLPSLETGTRSSSDKVSTSSSGSSDIEPASSDGLLVPGGDGDNHQRYLRLLSAFLRAALAALRLFRERGLNHHSINDSDLTELDGIGGLLGISFSSPLAKLPFISNNKNIIEPRISIFGNESLGLIYIVATESVLG